MGQRTQALDEVPFNAVNPSWGPDQDAFDVSGDDE